MPPYFSLPQVTTLESVLAMIPFTPDWWEARAANEALHNRRKMVAETNRAKHLVKLCEAGMHADALREQLHDSAQDFTDFNHVKDAMVKHDQWVWKPPRSMIKSAEASGADKSKLESSAVLRKVQRDFRMMTLDRPGDKPMHFACPLLVSVGLRSMRVQWRYTLYTQQKGSNVV